jgi:hypothetical protein
MRKSLVILQLKNSDFPDTPIIPKVSWIFSLSWIWAYFYSEDLCLVVCMKVHEINMQVTQINHLFSEGE